MAKADFMKSCTLKAPDFKKCNLESIQGLFSKLATGIAEIDVPAADPLHIDKLRILQGQGPVSVNASLENVVITGFSKTKIVENRVNLKNFHFYTLMKIPKLRIEGTYDLKGRILLVPLIGNGKCWFEPTDLDIEMRNEVNIYKRDNYHFFNVTASKVRFNVGGLTLNLNNLFDGLKALEQSTNAYLNANWRPVSESLRPILSQAIEDILVVLARQVFHGVPAEFFFGDFVDYLTPNLLVSQYKER
ncbi:uncharacterized protein LOC113383497 [Ctenocephalides felis]|uniref:uncharacterized protein LOC113383497 n=1 Tax=Ctenocephalides felis TaxID=7515 RepID=UPI000E6E3621|nr:uncharacterized protein LOC113383497 [Ctenocephalides felis]